MEQFFLICAAVGGTIFVCQFLLTLWGLGGSDMEVAHEVPHDFGGADAGHGDGPSVGHGDGHAVHGSTWLFSVITFRTLVAAVTFFGLTGYAALRGGQSRWSALAVAAVFGGAAMYCVHRLMQGMYRLGQDRTLRIDHAVGKEGSVYLTIPANRGGEGKVQISLQERLVEFVAMTPAAHDLPTGAPIVVQRVIGPGTVEVVPVAGSAEDVSA